MRAEVEKLDITQFVNVPTSFNILKTKVDDLDASKLRTFTVDLKNLSDVFDTEVVKNTKPNIFQTKVNNLDMKIPDAISLNQINQYNAIEINKN